MTTHRTRFYVGLGPNHNGQELTADQIRDATTAARAYLIRVYGGYTEYETRGGYRDPDADPHDPSVPTIEEDSMVFEVMYNPEVAPLPLHTANHFCYLFNQFHVYYTVEPVQAGRGTIPSPLTLRESHPHTYSGRGDDTTVDQLEDVPF